MQQKLSNQPIHAGTKWLLAALLMPGLALISGCKNELPSTKTISLAPRTPNVQSREPKSHVITPYVREFVDKRQNSSAGILYGRELLLAEDPLGWIRQTLQKRGYVFAPDPKPDDPSVCEIGIDLNVFDAQTPGTSKTVNIVMTLHMPEAAKDEVVRGRSTSVYWGATQRETSGAFSEALRQAMNKLDAQLRTGCATPAAKTDAGNES